MNNVWFAIAYMVIGFLALLLLGNTLADKVMRKEVGDDYKDESHKEECEQVEADYDAHIERLNQHVSPRKKIFVMMLLWLSWPVSVPIFMHRILTSSDFEDVIKFF